MMRKIKRAAALLFVVTAVFCFAFMPVSAAAGYEHIADNYSVLDGRDMENIDVCLEHAAKKTKMNICVVINGEQSLTTYGYQDYADVYYEKKYGKNTDGVCLAVWYDPTYVHFSTSGKGQKYYNSKTDPILDHVIPSLKNGDVSGAVDIFCRDLERYAKAERLKWLSYGLIGFVLGVFGSMIVFLLVVKRYKKYANTASAHYVDTSKTVFTERNDVFIRQYTTKTRIESNSSGGRGGGGSHTSSGGGSHGGGGRSF